MIKLRTLIISVVTGILMTVFPSLYISVFAASNLLPQNSNQNTNTNSGLTVYPALNNIIISEGQSSAVFKETVKSIVNYGVTVNVNAQDFGALNGKGTIGFFGSNYNPSNNPHSLVNSIQFSENSFYLKAKSSHTIQVTILNPNSLAPGGHYCALIFTPQITNQPKSGNVSLQPSVAALVFVTTASGGTQSLALSGLSVNPFRFTLPNNVYFLLTNTGNTQLTPRGYVSLNGPSGKLVSQSDFNSDSGQILPETNRLFSVNLPLKINLFYLPGFYHLTVHFRYDGASSYQTNSIRFFYFNPLTIIYIILLIIIIYLIYKLINKKKSKAVKKD